MPYPDPSPEASDAARQRLWRLSGMGMTLLGYIVGVALLGYLLDRWWGTLPWATVVGAALGTIWGMVDFVRQAMRASGEASREFRRDHPFGTRRSRLDDASTSDDSD